jgi:hypothetical protein
MNRLFQVVFTGQLLPGVNPEQAARDFAAVFKIPEEKAWRLILDQHEHVLKREVNEANAELPTTTTTLSLLNPSQLSTRGTVDSDIWYMLLVEQLLWRSYVCGSMAERL